MLTTTTTADHTIPIHVGVEVVTPDAMKAGETVQFSSTDGEIKIHFPGEWPFQGDKHDILGSQVDPGQALYTSEILTLKKGDTATRFQCFIKPPGATEFHDWKYGGEVKPR
jgi:hypothetical protein